MEGSENREQRVCITGCVECRCDSAVVVPMTNMEGGGGVTPAPSTPQDQPTDLRVVRAHETHKPSPLKQPPPLSLTALPLGLARAPSSFMIGDILRQKAQAEEDVRHLTPRPHTNDDDDNDDDDEDDGSQNGLSKHGE